MAHLPEFLAKRVDASKHYPIPVQIKLVRAAQNGSELARKELIESNLKFCYKVAVRYVKKDVDFLDLMTEAMDGVNTAIDRFNCDSGNAFLSYAVFWIKQRLSCYIRDHSRLIRIPANKQKLKANVMISMSSPIHEDGKATVLDTMEQSCYSSPEEDYENSKISQMVEEFIESLEPIDKAIISNLSEKGIPYKELSRRFNKSAEHIRKRYNDIIRNVRYNPDHKLRGALELLQCR